MFNNIKVMQKSHQSKTKLVPAHLLPEALLENILKKHLNAFKNV